MQKAKILVIDDEEDSRVFSKSILEKTNKFEVAISSSAVEGIIFAKTYKPDLILLDILMPAIDGPVAAKYLEDDPLTKDIPVAFLTALAKKEEMEAGLVGGHFFIAKPVTPLELVQQVENIIELHKK